VSSPGGQLRVLWGLAATPGRTLRALEAGCPRSVGEGALDELQGDPLAELVVLPALPARLGRAVGAPGAPVEAPSARARSLATAPQVGAPRASERASARSRAVRASADPGRVAAVLDAVRAEDAAAAGGGDRSARRPAVHVVSAGARAWPAGEAPQRHGAQSGAAPAASASASAGLPRMTAEVLGERPAPPADGEVRARAGRTLAPAAADLPVRAGAASQEVAALLEATLARADAAAAKKQASPASSEEPSKPQPAVFAPVRRAAARPEVQAAPPAAAPVETAAPREEAGGRFGGGALARLLARATPSLEAELAGVTAARPPERSVEQAPAAAPRLDHVRERGRLPDGGDLREELARILAREARRHGIDPSDGEG
jgi:hypothetical protein